MFSGTYNLFTPSSTRLELTLRLIGTEFLSSATVQTPAHTRSSSRTVTVSPSPTFSACLTLALTGTM